MLGCSYMILQHTIPCSQILNVSKSQRVSKTTLECSGDIGELQKNIEHETTAIGTRRIRECCYHRPIGEYLLLCNRNLCALGAVDALLTPLLARPTRRPLSIATVLLGPTEITSVSNTTTFGRSLLLLLLRLLL